MTTRRRILRSPTLWTSIASIVALVALTAFLMSPGLADTTPVGTRHFDGSGTTSMDVGSPPQTIDACTYDVAAEANVDEAATSGPATGTFDCTISDEAESLDFPFTDLAGTVTDFSDLTVDTAGAEAAVLHGTADLTTPRGDTQQAPMTVHLFEATPDGTQPARIRIELAGVFDGRVGDRTPGNNRYDMVQQTVTDGTLEITYEDAPSPSPSPSESPSPTPSPSPSATPTPTPTPTPSPTKNPTIPPPPPGSGGSGIVPPPPTPPTIGPPPYNTTGPWSTGQLMAILASISPTGQPQLSDILKVIGRFPVAGLASWSNDWHAYRCCPTPHLHQGVDISAPLGTPVVASADGYVSEIVDYPDSSGRAVQITDPSANIEYWYMHLSGYAPGLHVGQTVHISEVLGYVGDSGNPLPGAYHLHFEVRPNGVPVPPIPYVNAWLAQAEQAAYALAGPAYYSEATFPYAITHEELQRWLDQAAALAHDTSSEEDLIGGATPSPTPAPVGATPLGTSRPSATGWPGALAAMSLLMLLVVPGVVSGRRRAAAASAAVAARIGAPLPAAAAAAEPPTAPAPTEPAGGSAAVAAR